MALGCVRIVSALAYHIFGRNSFGCHQPKVQYSEGHDRQCKLLDEKLQQALADYNADDPINFLSSISHLTSGFDVYVY